MLASCSTPVAEDEPDEPCAIEKTVRLLPSDPSWRLEDPASPFEFKLYGERLIYQVGGSSGFGADSSIRGLCSDQTEHLLTAAEGLRSSFISDRGILFAEDAEGRLYAGDRLDEPGVDAPRALANYPARSAEPDVQRSREHVQGQGYLVVDAQGDPATQPRHAAGVGSVRETLWGLSGEREGDAVLLADEVVQHVLDLALLQDGILVHDDDGEVAWVDLRTAARTPVRTGVRWLTIHRSAAGESLVVQVIGDGAAEEVVLHDLATGEERPLTTNTDAGLSFGLDPARPTTGTWRTGPLLARVGPEGTLVEAYERSTLEPLEIPPHVGLSEVLYAHDHVGLVLEDPVDHVRALWDPATGALLEWYRGEAPDPAAIQRPEWHGGAIVFEAENPDGTRELIRLDVASGAREVLVSGLGTRLEDLGDGRIVHALGATSPLGAEIVVSVLGGGEVVLATGALRFEVFAHEGALLYANGAGLWATPL